MSTEKSSRKNTTFHIVYKKVCLAITFIFILCERTDKKGDAASGGTLIFKEQREKIKLFL